MTKIEKISINAIGGIDQLEIPFNPGMNLICGPNGVGKTTILECISHSFANFGSKTLRRNSKYASGSWTISLLNQESRTFTRNFFHPAEQGEYPRHAFQDHLMNVLVFKSNRQLDYIEVSAISKDPVQEIHTVAHEIGSLGTSPHDIKSWFLSRFVWSAHKDLLKEHQQQNLELAKKCFGIIDPNVSFKAVIPDTHEILLSAFGKDIYFEYLSSGYKSVLILLLGIIKQIEYRFKNPGIYVTDFDGLILIDEADLHLHPQWQSKLIKVFKEVVPKAQIIITTHSPHMIQTAEPNELIALGLNEGNLVYVRDLPSSEYGYQGWTVEEILKDVMGLEETRSDTYISILKDFEEALDKEDVDSAIASYKVLDLMLHSRNPLKKILEIQLAAIGGGVND